MINFICNLLALMIALLTPVESKLQNMKNISEPVYNESFITKFLNNEYEQEQSKSCYIATTKEWEHLIDINDELKAEDSAPVERSDETDFDPGAKFHIASDSQYISYFFAHILEFQLHRGLCIAAGEYNPKKPGKKPLHMCDIYKSKAAGKKLRRGLVLGASVHWKKVLKKITGETVLSGRALMEYFQPLFDYLQEANREIDRATDVET
ncbi:hypothetical protein Trydic_g13083 [Trypoxylus dichotomus]